MKQLLPNKVTELSVAVEFNNIAVQNNSIFSERLNCCFINGIEL